MRQKELREKVALLKDGQVVQIAGDFFRACRVDANWADRVCDECDLDSICRGDVELVCNEIDYPFYNRYYLKLAHP